MTLKHIKFEDSPVMRQLERDAARKGHFELTDNEIVNVATDKFKAELNPTGDALVDISRLTSVLREKGYEKQADELERNLLAYKTAEKHLYRAHDEDGEDVLNFAYPDGDVQVGDGEYGKVYTPQNQAKKILEIVNKEPTGKLATAAESILKSAQEGDVNIDVSGMREAKNSALAALKASDVASDGEALYHFTQNRLFGLQDNYLKAYQRYSKVVPGAVKKYKDYVAGIYQDDPYTAATLEKIINASSYDSLLNWVNRGWPSLVNFVTGSQASPIKKLSITPKPIPPIYEDNPNSVWQIKSPLSIGEKGFRKDAAKVKDLANRIQNEIVKVSNTVVGAKLEEANSKLAKELRTVLSPLIALKINDISYDPVMKESIKAVFDKLNDLNVVVNGYLPRNKNYNELAPVVLPFYPQGLSEFVSAMQKFQAELKKVMVSVGGRVGGSLGSIVEDSQVANTRYRKAIDIWESYIRSLPADHPNAERAKANLETSRKLYSATVPGKVNGRPYLILYNAISDAFGPLDSFSKLDQHSQDWLTYAREGTGL